MSREQILQETADVLKVLLEHSKFTLTETSTAKDIKGWDSLSHMRIMAAIENHFGVNFTFMEIVNMTDMGSMIDCLQDKL